MATTERQRHVLGASARRMPRGQVRIGREIHASLGRCAYRFPTPFASRRTSVLCAADAMLADQPLDRAFLFDARYSDRGVDQNEVIGKRTFLPSSTRATTRSSARLTTRGPSSRGKTRARGFLSRRPNARSSSFYELGSRGASVGARSVPSNQQSLAGPTSRWSTTGPARQVPSPITPCWSSRSCAASRTLAYRIRTPTRSMPSRRA